MNREPTLLSDFDVDERDDITAPCARCMKDGETITQAVVTPAWMGGVPDADFADRFLTPHQLIGTDVVQRVTEPVHGAWYHVRIVVHLSSGRRLTGACIFKGRRL